MSTSSSFFRVSSNKRQQGPRDPRTRGGTFMRTVTFNFERTFWASIVFYSCRNH